MAYQDEVLKIFAGQDEGLPEEDDLAEEVAEEEELEEEEEELEEEI